MTDEGRSTMDRLAGPEHGNAPGEGQCAQNPGQACQDPTRGENETDRPTPMPDFLRGSSGDPTDSDFSTGVPGPDSARHKACAGRTKDGRPCGIFMTALDADGTWKCRYHRSRPRAGERLRPPVTSVKSHEDAQRLMSWTMVKIAGGELSQSSALALVSASREWRQAFESGRLQASFQRWIDLAQAVVGDEATMHMVMGSKDEKVRLALRAIKAHLAGTK